ncbi:plasmid replication DNA-binding protein [Acinetobacter dispersus]|uniref:plasmid replication DNA-binding protein n=1 Tax=Acinetobacter dispersus TaxID=70348 RepID=UPI0021CD8DF0|nr:plasmid replication DNA-binding protein [Acinetobacter dispersus]
MQAVLPQYLHNSHKLNVSSCPAELFVYLHQKIMPGKNMSLLTILEASKQFKVGRTSIYKAIKRGDITPRMNAQNIQVIDAQDMVRVFGGSVPKSVSGNSTPVVSGNNEELVRELREQIQDLKQDKEFLKQEMASIRRDFDDFKLMIEYKGKSDLSETSETVSEQTGNSFGVQEKQQREQVETDEKQPQKTEKKRFGFLRRILGD